MDNTKEQYYSKAEFLADFRAYWRFVLKRWWIAVLLLAAGIGTGVLLYRYQQPKYEAVTTFILEDKAGGGGGLAGLASQMGINVGAIGGGSGIFTGNNILDILKSKRIVKKVLLSPVNEKDSSSPTLAQVYLTLSSDEKEKAAPRLQHKKPEALTPKEDSIINKVYEQLTSKAIAVERTSRQGSIIKVAVTAPDPQFARLMSERLVAEASELYLQIRTGTAQENIMQMQRKSDSLLYLLNRKSFSAAAAQPVDLNPGLRVATVPSEIATRDKSIIGALYGEVVKNLEASRLLLSQQTPVIQLLDTPEILLKDKKKRLAFMLVAGALAAGFLFVFFTFLTFLFKRKSLQEPDKTI